MAAHVAPAPRGADPKWPKLPVFDGSYNAYPSWKNQFELYIDGHPHHFANDAQKITWMLSYISGSPSAITWADEKRRNVQVLGIQNGTPPDYGDWDTFVIALNKRFLDPVARQKVSRQLFMARQGQLPLDEFFNYFDLWVSLSGINDDRVLLDLMKDTVNPQIVQALGIRGWPASYADFKLAARELDHIQQDLRQGSMFTGAHRQNVPRPQYQARTSTYQGISQQACNSGRRQPNATYFPVPVADNNPSYMLVQTGTGTTFLGHGQPMEIGRRCQNRPGSCHQCGQMGHFARNCPCRQGGGGGQQGQRQYNAP
jgi:Zinc knuckle